jgi:hypothetical protein
MKKYMIAFVMLVAAVFVTGCSSVALDKKHHHEPVPHEGGF